MDNIDYLFHYPDGKVDRITVATDRTTKEVTIPDDYVAPDWTLLAHNKCINCSLDEKTDSYCPVARNISCLFADLATKNSYDEVRLEVVKKGVSYSTGTTMQRALSSLLGLVCALSPCPRSRFLKPMGIFHLPLSSELDSLSRAFSFFMMKKYFELKDSRIGHIDVGELVDNYKNLRIMNHCFAQRIRHIDKSDAPVNAIVLLDLLAQYIDFEIEEQLNELRVLFES